MTQKLIDKLPKIRGKIRENAPLKNWFDIDSKAEILFKPADIDDLRDFLKNCDKNIPILILGAGSNVIIKDELVKAVVIRLGAEFSKIQNEGEILTSGCASLCKNIAQFSQNQALSGLEFFSGIPGCLGGAIAMNAGCYGDDVAKRILSVKAVDYDGNLHILKKEDFEFSYRKNKIAEKFIFVEASFKLQNSTTSKVFDKITELCKNREEAQPIRAKTGGSTFKNPFPDDISAKKAWQLIDEAGCRGFKINDAEISQKHCNFMINSANATANDLIKLGNYVKSRVKEVSNIDLEWEIKLFGTSKDEEN